MRIDSPSFARDDRARDRRPRYVIRIEFPTATVYCTSHDDISGIPGVVVDNVLKSPAAVSQRLWPDEGRSEIGTFSFTLVDLQGTFTDAIRAHWFDEEGLRDREVQFFIGYEGYAFSAFQLFTTQTVVADEYKSGVYTVQCRDITRIQNKEVFKPVATTLRQSVTATETTIPVGDTTDFEMVAHGTSYTDAPSSTVGYIRLEDEIIRWTAKTANAFTGCTRGVLNTVAKPHAISDTASQDRQPKVEEFIYLEMPGPKLAYAVLTGVIYGTANVLPEHWHLGIGTSLIKLSDFTGIGLDLWNASIDTDSLVLRFEGLKAQDGKRFVEKEIYLLLGCFSPVYSNGQLGLRRMSPLISNASPAATLTESVITEITGLVHDGESMHNQFRINWAWDSLADDYVRESRFVDATSIEVHGISPLLTYEFRGLHGERHTDATIAQRLASIRDRYATPPERISVTVFGSLNRLEVGDVVRLKLSEQTIRDYALETADFNRSFEVHQQSYDAANGRVTLELFGSTFRPQGQPPIISDFSALPDSWYASEGASLASVLTIVTNVVQAGSYTINGATTLSGAIFYHDGDLTVADGATITITGNVQLRIQGFLQINGEINGTGGGHGGISDPGTGPWDSTWAGIPGYVGNSRGWDGLSIGLVRGAARHQTISAVIQRGHHDAFPVLELSTDGGLLSGLPSDLRGGGGAPGGRAINGNGNSVLLAGGAGAAGGAGLAITCRGMAFGASGSITLDGASSSTTTTTTTNWAPGFFSGAGGPGGPGSMLVLLDGSGVSFPLIAGKFFSRGGTVPVQGQPVPSVSSQSLLAALRDAGLPANTQVSGFADPTATTLSGFDYSTVSYGIQYLAEPVGAEGDQHPRPPAPTGLSAASAAGGNLLTWTSPDPDLYNVIEVYASQSLERSDALFIGETKGNSFHHYLPLGGRRQYWIRAARTWADGRPVSRSEWEPLSESAGATSNAETPGETPDSPADLYATGMTNGIRFTWALPAVGRLLGKVQLFESASPSPFSAATMVWEGYAMSYFLKRYDTTTRYYWVRLFRGGQESITEPDGNGIAAASSSVTAVLAAAASPTAHTMSQVVSPSTLFTFTTPSTTVTASGGVPGYSYSWAFVSGGDGIVINSSTSAVTTFSSTATSPASRTGTARCTVTDNLGITAYADVGLKFIFKSPVF